MSEVDPAVAASATAPPTEPHSALEDIVTSVLTPGYVGQTVWRILTGAIVLFCVITVIHAYNDPSTFNLLSLLILIPAVGLLFSFRWFVLTPSLRAAISIAKISKTLF